MPQTISPAEAQRRIEAGAVLIDIRSPDEYARAHIPCARNLPLAQIDRIDGAPEVIFHCKSGMRTKMNAGKLAAKSGDCEVYLLGGGIDAWKRAGLPTSSQGSGLKTGRRRRSSRRSAADRFARLRYA